MIEAAEEAVNELLGKRYGKRIGVYNGVSVRDIKPLDTRDHYPAHKRALCLAALEVTRPGDNVVTVGGGRGVLATKLAEKGREVSVYEAAVEMVDTLEETAALNDVFYEVKHAVVGSTFDVYGTMGDAMTVPPSELSGDVLVLDCEGAELDILPASDFDTVVVETHPSFGASTEKVTDLLDDPIIFAPDPVCGDVVIA